MMCASKQSSFKVIVVGGGITGLVMSNALSKAQIEHVVFESRNDIVYPAGGSFGLWPHVGRILEQLGCWDLVKQESTPLDANLQIGPGGKVESKSDLFRQLANRHGYDFLVLERPVYTRILLQSLPEQSRVVTGRRVTGIAENAEGVRVYLNDGSYEEGDIVVGCDGVHSAVRTAMWQYANQVLPGTISAEEKRSLSSCYRCLVGVAPAILGLKRSDASTIQNQGYSVLVVNQPTQVFFFVCIRSSETIRWPTKQHFSTDDAEKEAAKIADLPVSEDTLFGEIWARRRRGYLCCIEEGIYKHWHFGRTILVGDAAHKMSPVLAIGGNCAVEIAVVLVNHLKRLVDSFRGERPTMAALSETFDRYDAERRPRVQRVYETVHTLTRLQTWDTWLKKIRIRYIVPCLKDDLEDVSRLVRTAPRLDFLPDPSQHPGKTGDRKAELVSPKNKYARYVSMGRFVWCLLAFLYGMMIAYVGSVLKHHPPSHHPS